MMRVIYQTSHEQTVSEACQCLRTTINNCDNTCATLYKQSSSYSQKLTKEFMSKTMLLDNNLKSVRLNLMVHGQSTR